MQESTRKLAVALLLAGTTAGCGWLPWSKKPDQGLSWATPDVSKTYGTNQIAAERGGSIAPRTEMPKPEKPPEGTMARMTSAVTKPVKAMTAAFKKPAGEAAAPASVASYPGDAKEPASGAKLFVGLARLQEGQGNTVAAAESYERALKAESNNLDALIGYARLMDRQGNFPKAIALYQTATRLHPKEATAFNDLGLCLSRQGKHAEATAVLAQAVRLKPDRKLYRNNLAKLLVDAGQPQQALEHLSAVHTPAEAQYNLGYLLHQKGQVEMARRHFIQALTLDPNMTDAREWLAMIEAPRIPEAPPQTIANRGPQMPPTQTQPAAPAGGPRYPDYRPQMSTESGFYQPSRY